MVELIGFVVFVVLVWWIRTPRTSMRVFVDDVELPEDDYTVDWTAGKIDFKTPPTGAVRVVYTHTLKKPKAKGTT